MFSSLSDVLHLVPIAILFLLRRWSKEKDCAGPWLRPQVAMKCVSVHTKDPERAVRRAAMKVITGMTADGWQPACCHWIALLGKRDKFDPRLETFRWLALGMFSLGGVGCDGAP